MSLNFTNLDTATKPLDDTLRLMTNSVNMKTEVSRLQHTQFLKSREIQKIQLNFGITQKTISDAFTELIAKTDPRK